MNSTNKSFSKKKKAEAKDIEEDIEKGYKMVQAHLKTKYKTPTSIRAWRSAGLFDTTKKTRKRKVVKKF